LIHFRFIIILLIKLPYSIKISISDILAKKFLISHILRGNQLQ